MIKETCFGLVINGKEEEVDRIITELRKIDPDHIFVKDRGFPRAIPAAAGQTSVEHARGYHGMENEMTVIPYVSHGLETIKTRDIATIPPPQNPSSTRNSKFRA